MQPNLISKVAVEKTAYSFDTEFTYFIPSELINVAKVGCRVLVPFGGGNRKRQGIIVDIKKIDIIDKNLKSIHSVLDDEPILNNEMISLIRFMKNRYFCTLYEGVQTILPAGIRYIISKTYDLVKDIDPKIKDELKKDEIKLFEFILNNNGSCKEDEIVKVLGEKYIKIINNLVDKGILVNNNKTIQKIKDASIKMVKIKNENTQIKLTPKQNDVYSFLSSVECAALNEVIEFTGVTKQVINTLIKKEVIEVFENEIYREPYSSNILDKSDDMSNITLTESQKEVYNNLHKQYSNDKASAALLYGVTGSGKTLIFIKIVDEVIKKGKSVIIMLPEIALTTHMIKIFKNRYGDKISIFHSRLSLGERLDEYKRVKKGEACIAIGTRSAVFAPFDNLGLVIIDEEQEHTYKSESNPRYSAHDIAKFRCNYNNGMLILSSATPSLNSYYYAKQGIYSLNVLNERYGKAKLPKITIVDMNKEVDNGNLSLFSYCLQESIRENLQNKKQSILLLNRRGYHTFVTCTACKEVLTCPNCSISLTYHANDKKLMCHYCGYSKKITNECPNCNEEKIRYTGIGTQHIEKDIEELFPDAKVLRVDADSTTKKYSYDEKFKQFSQGEYDIMIGTQMVAKGLDFENVTLVGVINADQSLYSDSYKSYEQSFDLITQVVGRSGRGDFEGKAIIQTYTPENPTIKLAAKQDYVSFYNSEIEIRKLLLYPPFCDICVICALGEKEQTTKLAINEFNNMICNIAREKYNDIPLRVLLPCPAGVTKVKNKFRYKIVIKCKNNNRFRDMIAKLLIQFSKKKEFRDVNIFADINPSNII